MKVPTKMWGKGRPDLALLSPEYRLNESPPKKEGKFFSDFTAISTVKVPQ